MVAQNMSEFRFMVERFRSQIEYLESRWLHAFCLIYQSNRGLLSKDDVEFLYDLDALHSGVDQAIRDGIDRERSHLNEIVKRNRVKHGYSEDDETFRKEFAKRNPRLQDEVTSPIHPGLYKDTDVDTSSFKYVRKPGTDKGVHRP